MARRNLIAGAVLLLVGIGYGIVTSGLPERALPNTPGPAFLPWLITAAWLILAAALLVRGIREARTETAPATGGTVPSKGWLALGAFVVYLVLMPRLGFVPMSIPFFAALMWLYGERNRNLIATISIAVPFFLFYLFTEGFQILLPRGPWM